ncbi:hypothetical protein HJFPF1_12325 [Paramyrothecium foliicola]|nr:hypothetical protein HJFPF1_12325 [Paramyrothecium foliicola]
MTLGRYDHEVQADPVLVKVVQSHEMMHPAGGQSSGHDSSSDNRDASFYEEAATDGVRPKVIEPKLLATAASSVYTARSSCSSDGSASTAARSTAALRPKIGTRFSKNSTRFLRQWLETHQDHPFPSRGDNEMLQQFTGLS